MGTLGLFGSKKKPVEVAEPTEPTDYFALSEEQLKDRINQLLNTADATSWLEFAGVYCLRTLPLFELLKLKQQNR